MVQNGRLLLLDYVILVGSSNILGAVALAALLHQTLVDFQFALQLLELEFVLIDFPVQRFDLEILFSSILGGRQLLFFDQLVVDIRSLGLAGSRLFQCLDLFSQLVVFLLVACDILKQKGIQLFGLGVFELIIIGLVADVLCLVV